VVDSRLEAAPSARVFGRGTLVALAERSEPHASELEARGVELLRLPHPSGKVDLAALLHELGRRGMNEVHVEAGSKLNGSLLREGLVDELLIYLAPTLLGDRAQGMFALPPLENLSERRDLDIRDVSRVGRDIRIVARLKA
jgi:diaminohydroxyphosphoribosylaminopyrimidine deaminase/5-amino-6-(5-phosphoribosylamino)uracil reductase